MKRTKTTVSTEQPQKKTDEKPDGRDAEGKFAKGNRGGPGNPFARQTARLRQAALDAVSPEQMSEVFQALHRNAVNGDVAAAKLLLSYTIGKPTAAENPDTLDQQEFRIMVANTAESAEGPVNIINGMPLDLLVQMLRIVIPAMRPRKAQLAKSVLCAPLTEDEIEANEDAEMDDDDDREEAAAPAEDAPVDPLANVPEWMLKIGKETDSRKPKKDRRKTAPRPQPQTAPVAPEVDADLLRVFLERAGNFLAGTEPSPSTNGANGKHPPVTKRENGVPPPSTNGKNGKN